MQFIVQLKGMKNLLKKSMTPLTDHKDGECVVYWCVTVGGLKGVNSTLWHFQSHQPQLAAVPKRKASSPLAWMQLAFY